MHVPVHCRNARAAPSCVLMALATLVLAANALTASGGAVRVADFTPDGREECAGTCTTTCPCSTLQLALDAAADGDEVWLRPPAAPATIPCEGARTNRSVSLRPHPDAAGRDVVLDCRGLGRALWVEGYEGAAPQLTISDLTFRNGNADVGGCVLAEDAVLTAQRCVFENCASTSAHYGGGAVGVLLLLHRSVTNPLVSFASCQFRGCRAAKHGGSVLVLTLPGASTPGGSITVRDCVFQDTQAGEDGGAICLWLEGRDSPNRTVTMVNTRFERSRAGNMGGALDLLLSSDHSAGAMVTVSGCEFFDTRAVGEGGAMTLMLSTNHNDTRVAITDCIVRGAHSGSDGGGVAVVMVGDDAAPASAPGPASQALLLAATRFEDCHAVGSGGGLYASLTVPNSRGSTVRVLDSIFARTTAEQLGGGLALRFAGERAPDTSALVQDCVFEHTSASQMGGAAMVRFVGDDSPNASFAFLRCQVRHSAAVHMGGALNVHFVGNRSPDASLLVAQSRFRNTRSGGNGGALFAFVQGTASTRAALAVSRCAFVNASADANGGAVGTLVLDGASADARLNVTDVHFERCWAGGAGGALWLSATVGSDTAVSSFAAQLSNCSVTDTSAGAQGGAVFAALSRQPQLLMPIHCTFASQATQRAWLTSSSLLLQDCTLERVAATEGRGVGGGVAVAGGALTMRRCSVTDARAGFAGGVLHSSGSASVTLQHVTASGAVATLDAGIHHAGEGLLVVTDTQFVRLSQPPGADSSTEAQQAVPVLSAPSAAARPLFSNSQLQCGVGEVLRNASRGEAAAAEEWLVLPHCMLVEPPSQGLAHVRSFSLQWRCEPCPLGTYFLSAGRVQGDAVAGGECLRCPFGATCAGRAAVAAAPGMWTTPLADGSLPTVLTRCVQGYCCNSDRACRRHDSCAPTRTGVLCGQCEAGTTGALGSTRCRLVEQCGRAWQDVAFWPASVVAVLGFVAWHVRMAEESSQLSSSLIKATFAYYQSLPLLLIADSSAGALRHVVDSSLLALFSFRVPTLGEEGGGAGVCPFVGLTPLRKELVAVAMAVAVLLALPLVQAMHAVVAWFAPAAEVRCGGRARCRLSLMPPRPTAYASAFTSLTMLTYTSLATSAMRMVGCAEVGELGRRLLLQGEVECWTWWQALVWLWLACSSLLVPAALAYGGWLLRRGAIRPGAFWLSLFLPLPCMVRWAVLQWRGQLAVQRKRDVSAMHVSTRAALEETYRRGAWWWDSVLLTRRLLLALMGLVLQQQPVVQALACAVVVLAALMAQLHWRPFASGVVNALESGFLAGLMVAAILAVRQATLASVAAHDNEQWRAQLAAGVLLLLTAGFPALLALYGAWTWWRGRCRGVGRQSRQENQQQQQQQQQQQKQAFSLLAPGGRAAEGAVESVELTLSPSLRSHLLAEDA